MSLIDKPSELLELISKSLKPKIIEKTLFGEVFTPMPIVNEMLDKLPIEVWTNKNLKWLDPASGMGNFPIGIYLRLIDSLKNEIPDDKERKKHILENMIYMCELNNSNVLKCKDIFDINNEYKLNLYQGDTLLFEPLNTFKINQFDIILGNPPFNNGSINNCKKRDIGEKHMTIWTKFIEVSFKWLKINGYLAYITPLPWLEKTHMSHIALLEKYIMWLKIWDGSESKKQINAGISISIYVLQNSLNIEKKKTDIISKIGDNLTVSNIYLDKNDTIPLGLHSIFNKLKKFIECNKLKLEYFSKVIKSIEPKIKIPFNFTYEDMLAVHTYTIKDGIMVKKMIKPHQYTRKRKIIIANKSSFKGTFIDDGKLELTGHNKFYIFGDNLELILKLTTFKLFTIICDYCKYHMDFLNKESFEYIPDIRKLGIKDITEEEFYKLIGLDKNEINLIDNI